MAEIYRQQSSRDGGYHVHLPRGHDEHVVPMFGVQFRQRFQPHVQRVDAQETCHFHHLSQEMAAETVGKAMEHDVHAIAVRCQIEGRLPGASQFAVQIFPRQTVSDKPARQHGNEIDGRHADGGPSVSPD